MGWKRELELYPREKDVLLAEQRAEGRPNELGVRMYLAWALRQTDTARARELATAALSQIASHPAFSQEDRVYGTARMQLVLGEAHCMVLEIDEAQRLLDQARVGFEALHDERGLADLCFVAHYLAADRGDTHRLREVLIQATAHAERSGDKERLLFCRATLARSDLFRDIEQARAHWNAELPKQVQGLSAPAASALADYWGLQSGLTSDFVGCVQWFVSAYDLALESGQQRRAISIASNLGYAYATMSDVQTAVEWLKRGLDVARRVRWPGSIGLCLAQTGDALRRVGQTDSAREMLRECQQILAAHPSNRSVLLSLKYLGQTEQDCGRFDAALEQFETLAERARRTDARDLTGQAEYGRARALLQLSRLPEARAAALQAAETAQAQNERINLVDIWWLMADVEQAESADPQRVMQWLEKAMELAGQIDSYLPPAALLDAAASAQAGLGAFERAYQLSRRAADVRQAALSAEATKKSAALHSRHQMETARAEREHQRRLAEADAAKAQVQKSAQDDLLRLASLGTDITAEFEPKRLCEALQRQVQLLLGTQSMAVYAVDDAQQHLCCLHGVEAGKPFSDPPISLDSSTSSIVKAWRERREVTSGLASALPAAAAAPASGAPRSMLFAPLVLGSRALGVLAVMSTRGQRFGERELLLFRSLCAHAALALDNARAYERLAELQRQLLDQEELAALGARVSSLARELQAPLGEGLNLTRSLLVDAQALATPARGPAARDPDWRGFVQRTREHLQRVEGELSAAARLADGVSYPRGAMAVF
jgi:tetratricopeptide (TPR) repeat protein